jgi:hypothetical protein
MKISGDHPLPHLFRLLTERNLAGKLGYEDPDVIGYVSDLLTDFTHIDNLFKIRSATGQRVEEIAELLMEADLLYRATSVEREREVHKHIGDYTLFMAGLFPEAIRRGGAVRVAMSRDALIDYVKTGKRSYRIVAEFAYGAHRGVAPLYRKLSEQFELCVFGLGYVRSDLDRLRRPEFQRLVDALAE